MNSIKLSIPFIIAFILLSIPLKLIDQKTSQVGIQPGFSPPPHIEPNAIQTENQYRRDQPSISELNPVAANNVITNVFGLGDNQIHGLIYSNGSLWASTRTDPARILRINPSTLALESPYPIVLANGQADAEDITAGQGYIWTILYTDPAQLIRVDPATNTAQTALTFTNIDPSKILLYGASLKYAFGYLWAGGLNRLARIDISNPLNPTYQNYDFSFLATKFYVVLTALTYSNNDLWGIFTQYDFDPISGLPFPFASTITKLIPSSPTTGYVTNTVSTLFPDDITYAGTHFYTSSENQPVQTTPSYLYEFDDSLAAYKSTLVSNSASYGTFMNPNIPASFWGAYVASPGNLIKFDLNSNPMTTITLPFGFNDPSEIVFDPIGNMYVSTWQSPAGIVKYSLQHPINIPIVMKNKIP